MPTKNFFFTIAASAMVIFSGCQKTMQPQISATQQVSQYSASDTAAYQGALQLKDAKMCDKISDPNGKINCKKDINDQTALEAAITKTDASLCNKMSTADKKKACEINVETQIKLQEQSKLHQKSLDDMYALQNKIVQSGDYTQCKTLNDPNVIIGCESTILTTKALQSKNETYCDKISDADEKSRCHQLVKTSAQVTTK